MLIFGFFVLQNKELQHSAVDAVTESLSKQVGSKVSIDQIEWNFPNSFVLKNVYIEDRQCDTMLFMSRTKVTINLLKLLSSQISFRTIQFTGLEANLSVDSTNTPNFGFFIDAFKPDPNDTVRVTWSMDIESAAFENCQISYKNPNKSNWIGRMNPNDLHVYDFNGFMYFRSFVKDSVNIIVEDVSFKEKSGLVVDEISSSLLANKETLSVKKFLFKMPNSELRLKELTAFHDNYTAFKDPINKLRLRFEFGETHIRPSDFSVFRPALDMITEPVEIQGAAYGLLREFQVANLLIKYGDATCLSGNMYVKDLFPKVQNVKLNGTVERLSSNASDLSDILWVAIKRDVQLSKRFNDIGTFAYSGSLNGNLTNMLSDGSITTNLGKLDLSVLFTAPDLQLNSYNVKGQIKTNDCHLDRFLGKESGLGNLAFNLDIVLDKLSDQNFKLAAKGDVDSFYYKNYCYQNLTLNGSFDKKGFDGTLIMSDKNAEFNFEGKVDLRSEKPFFHFNANVMNFNLYETHLLNVNENSQTSFNIETNFTGSNIDELEGSFSVDNFLFSKGDREFGMNNFSLSVVTKQDNKKKMSIFSDYVNGTLVGTYSFATLPKCFYNLAHKYFPALIKDEKPIPEGNKKNDFTFDLSVENMESIQDIVDLPLIIQEESKLKGFYNENEQKFRVRLEVPLMKKGNSSWSDLMFLCENPRDQLKLICRTTILPKNKRRYPYYLSVSTLTKENDIDLKVSFNNSAETTYSGKIDLKALFKDYEKGKGLTADFLINPSHVYLNDTMWTIHESKIAIDKKRLEVDSFLFKHEAQFLCIDGTNTEEVTDSLNIHFSDLSLGYFSDIIANPNISFNGVTDGDVFLFRLFKQPFFKGGLYIYDGAINECVLGDMSVNTSWVEKEKCIGFDVDILSPFMEKAALSKSVIHGGVFLGNDSLYIGGDLKDIDMRFLRKYMKNVLQNNTGTVSGHVAAYGKFGNIGLEGMAYVRDMAFDVDFLKTSYVLSDSVKLTPHTIELNQVQVFDTEGNYAVVSGMMLHDAFKNFKFAFDLGCDNLLVMNTKEEDNETFYGKAYAQGVGHFSGTTEVVNINLAMKTMPNTLMTIPIESTSSAKESSFVTFVAAEDKKTMAEKRKQRREKLKKISQQKAASSTVINLDMDLEATTDAQIHLIMDAQQGDIIKTNGNGSLHLSYNTKDNAFKMYGGYEIERGDYLFTIQSIISRKFEIEKGSMVQWTGNPTNAALNIQAKYSLNASLNDIVDDPNLRTNTTLVNCLLGLTGTISSPIIKFDIELPNSDDDVRSKLRSVINTDEAMNRNIASLLALGHFYNMDKSASSVATTELSSVGFSTLSSQLTNWISKMNQDVSIGLNYRPTSTNMDGTTTSSEFDVALSTQLLNDRLLLNGNFGYRDEVTDAENISNSIIDFDIEYKLNKSGKLRTKGFNRSNNSYFKQAPNTQGLGIVYREDFDTFSELFKSYLNSIKGAFKRKERNVGDIEKKEEDENTQQ